jgi:DDE family transposase
MWVSIRQQILGDCSLERAWAFCSEAEVRRLSPKSARAKSGVLSPRASGFNDARHALPLALVEDAADRLFWEAWSTFHVDGPPILLLDGTSLTPDGEPELAEAYPASPTQHGRSHWPVLRVVMVVDLGTGLSIRPEYGPMFGPDAVGEQTLAKRLLHRIPRECLVVADRNFGIFQMAWALRDRGMLVRLKEQIACSILGDDYVVGQDYDEPVAWKPSAGERKVHGFPDDACVHGRIVVRTVHPAHEKEPVTIYLFTNDMKPPAEAVMKTYTGRWNIESDIRSLKQSVGLEALRSRSVDMLSKEILFAVAAYNLVRVVMVQAAKKANLEPRRISFSRTRDHIQAFLTRGPMTPALFERMLERIAAKPLPLRPGRHYPRQIWTKGNRYPPRKVTDMN